MQIQHEEGRFFIANDGKDLAEITFRKDEDTKELLIDHTRVSEELRGQGTGEVLVKAVVEKARTEDYKIVPICSYAVRQFEKHPEYKDVLSGNTNGSN